MNSKPLAKYNALIESGILQPDSGQADVVARLNSLSAMLKPASLTQIFKKNLPKKLKKSPPLEREERGVSRPMALEEEKSSLQVS